MSGLIGANNQFAQEFNHPDFKLQGIITSICDIGCAAGALFNFFFGEKFGRKNMMIAGGTTMIICTILLGSSTTVAQLVSLSYHGVNSVEYWNKEDRVRCYGVCVHISDLSWHWIVTYSGVLSE
jgi:MFS family permease